MGKEFVQRVGQLELEVFTTARSYGRVYLRDRNGIGAPVRFAAVADINQTR